MIATRQLRHRLASVLQGWALMHKPCRPRCPARPFQPSRCDCLRVICKELTRMIIVSIIHAGAHTHDFSLPNVVDLTCVLSKGLARASPRDLTGIQALTLSTTSHWTSFPRCSYSGGCNNALKPSEGPVRLGCDTV